MAMGSFNSQGTPAPTAEINMTPLVDVMLVLLIIFIITAPLMQHKVKIDLPQTDVVAKDDDVPKVMPITVSVKEDGSLFWNDEAITREVLESRLSSVAQQVPQPKLNLRGDRTTKMRTITDVTKLAQAQGMLDVGFVATKEKGP